MSEVVAVILVIAVLLALVSLMLPLADRYGLPYTTLLAALGLGLGFLAVAAAASFFPALRAASVEPVEALRSD